MKFILQIEGLLAVKSLLNYCLRTKPSEATITDRT